MRITFLLFFTMSAFNFIYGQKLPDIQNSSVSVPVKLRIDGNLSEWPSSFAAENKRTNVYYSLSHDSQNLYLALKSVNDAAVAKIMLGGISLTINTMGKKKDDDSFTITYPLITRNAARTGGQNRQRGSSAESSLSQAQKDSVTLVQRRTQLAGVKEIKVLGLAALTDSLISIYNEHGIKAVAKIADDGTYGYELAIPLGVLGISATTVKEVAYRIRLNGRPMQASMNNRANANTSGFGSQRGGFGGSDNAARQDLFSTTDFWGKYSFIK